MWIRLWLSVRSFAVDFWSFFSLPFVSPAKKIVVFLMITILVYAGYKSTETTTHTFALSGHQVTSILITGISLIWVTAAVGYAIAKFHRLRIVPWHIAKVSVEHFSFRIPIRVEGWGKAKITATVQEVRDATGRFIEDNRAGGSPIEVTYQQGIKEVEMTEEDTGFSFSLFCFEKNCLCVHGYCYHPEILTSESDRSDIYVLVSFTSNDCPTVKKWYAVQYRPETPLKYLPLTVDDNWQKTWQSLL